MGIDISCCKNVHQRAVAIKTALDLSKATAREKLGLGRIHREKQGVSCGIVTGRDIPRTLSNSLRWLHGGVPTKGLVPSAAMRQNLLDSFFKLFQDYAMPFRQIIHIVEEHAGFSPGRWLRPSSIRSSRDEP